MHYRLSAAARADIIDILAWTHEQFGEAARKRYEALIVTGLIAVAGMVRSYRRERLYEATRLEA